MLNMVNLYENNNETQNDKKDNDSDDNITIDIILQHLPIKIDENVLNIKYVLLEFRCFISNNIDNNDMKINAITQIQNFLNLQSQDSVKKASKSFLLPYNNDIIKHWNQIFHKNSNIDNQQTNDQELFKTYCIAIISDIFNNNKNNIKPHNCQHYYRDLYMYINTNNEFCCEIGGISRLPIYVNGFGLFNWETDKNIILNGDNNGIIFKILMDNNNESYNVGSVLPSNVIDYLYLNKWSKITNFDFHLDPVNTIHTQKQQNNNKKCCYIL